jgi:hypothetical protein
MKIKLNYGYVDLDEAEFDHNHYLKFTRNIHAEMWEDEETKQIFVTLWSPYRFEIKKYVERFLGNMPELADTVIDENIVQE